MGQIYVNSKLANLNPYQDFHSSPLVKNLPANAGDEGSIPGLGRSHMLQSLCSIPLKP